MKVSKTSLVLAACASAAIVVAPSALAQSEPWWNGAPDAPQSAAPQKAAAQTPASQLPALPAPQTATPQAVTPQVWAWDRAPPRAEDDRLDGGSAAAPPSPQLETI